MASRKQSVMPNIEPGQPDHRVDQYRDEIILYLKKRVLGCVAEDLAEETLLTAQAYLNSGNTLDGPLAFLYETADFIAGKNYRAQKAVSISDTVADIDLLGLESEVPSVERSVVWELEFEAFCVAIARLPDRCRKAFVLKTVCQYPDKQVAEYSGVSVYTVNKHINRGFELVQTYREESQGVELR